MENISSKKKLDLMEWRFYPAASMGLWVFEASQNEWVPSCCDQGPLSLDLRRPLCAQSWGLSDPPCVMVSLRFGEFAQDLSTPRET